MADEPEDDELILDTPLEPDEDEQRGEDDPENPNVNDETDEEEEVLTFGDDVTDEKPDDSSVIKHLRQAVKDARREAAEARSATPKAEPIEIGPKPTLEACNYDEEELGKQLDDWYDLRDKAAVQKGQAKEAEEAQRKDWEAELNRYSEGKAKLGFADIEDAEETIKLTFDPVQQAVMVKASDDPARVMYALAKHPDRLSALAAIKDPLKLAAAIAKLEGQLKVVKRRKAPDPDTPVRGSGKISNAGSPLKQLEKMEADWEKKGGDRTEIQRFKAKLKAEGKLK